MKTETIPTITCGPEKAIDLVVSRVEESGYVCFCMAIGGTNFMSEQLVMAGGSKLLRVGIPMTARTQVAEVFGHKFGCAPLASGVLWLCNRSTRQTNAEAIDYFIRSMITQAHERGVDPNKYWTFSSIAPGFTEEEIATIEANKK